MTTDNPAAPAVDGAPVTAPEATSGTPAPTEATPAPEPSAGTEPATEAAPEAAKEGEPEGQEEQKAPKVRFHERISQLVSQRKQAEAERDAALAEVQRLSQGLRPQNYDDLDFETQQRINTQEAVNAAMAEQAYSRAQHLERQAAATVAATFQTKVEAVRDQLPDFDLVFNGAVPVTPTMAEIIAESDRAPQVAYYLGKNPHEAARIASLPAHRQGLELARIEARVSPPSQARKVSRAPEPPPTVGATATQGVKDPARMSVSEMEALLYPRAKR